MRASNRQTSPGLLPLPSVFSSVSRLCRAMGLFFQGTALSLAGRALIAAMLTALAPEVRASDELPGLARWVEQSAQQMAGHEYTRTLSLATSREDVRAATALTASEEDVVCEPVSKARLVMALDGVALRLGVLALSQSPELAAAVTQEVSARMQGERGELCESVLLAESDGFATYYQVYHLRLGAPRQARDLALIAATRWLTLPRPRVPPT